MAFPIIPRKRSGSPGNPDSLLLGELAVNCATGELFLGADEGVTLLNGPVAGGTTTTEATGDGITTAFTFTGFNGTADGGYLVSVGGIDQPPSKYSVTDTAGGTLTFVEAPTDGELISIRAIVAGSGGGGDGNATSLQSFPISETDPASGQGLIFDGTEWAPSAVNATKIQGTEVTVAIPSEIGVSLAFNGTEWAPGTANSNAIQIQYRPIDATAPTTGAALVWDGTNWAPADVNAVKLQGQAVLSSAPTTGDLLKFNGSSWEPASPVLGKSWDVGTTYDLGDIVSFQQNNGAINIYVSTVNANIANTPGPSGGWVQVVQLAAAAPASDGGLASAGITVAGWLQVEIAGGGYYKIPYFQ